MKKTQHLLDIKSLSKQEIEDILETAQAYIDKQQHLSHQLDTLSDKTIANLFFENSTRTAASFELAAQRLGADVLTLNMAAASTQKGESVEDTVNTLQSMGCDAVIIRHQQENIAAYIAEHVPNVCVINAGDGTHAHPSQALLDMLTIKQHKNNFGDLSVAIVGDIAHSRVARSDIAALQCLGVADIRLIGPSSFLPEDIADVTIADDMSLGLQNVDVIMMLRIQKERMTDIEVPDLKSYTRQFGLTEEKLQLAKSSAIVMHPGPINRGVEVTAGVADGEQSVIRQQVTNGVATRMAIFSWLL